MTISRVASMVLVSAMLVACSDDGDDPIMLGAQAGPQNGPLFQVPQNDLLPAVGNVAALDQQLQALVDEHGLAANPGQGRGLPDIEDPLPQLGMTLFFSKSLSGEFDAACASCHHPALAGADALSLPVGTNAMQDDVLGPGREHQSGLPQVPRNSPTVFNAGLLDAGMFWDSRVESLGKEPGANGALSGIRTPDSPFASADPQAGDNLSMAQAAFPVLEQAEMRGDFLAGASSQELRDHLAARLGDYGDGAGELVENEWQEKFSEAYGVTGNTNTLVSFENIVRAIGEYERSMVFTDSPWNDYLTGDAAAITDAAKRGAILFLSSPDDGGAGCVACHSGSLFSDGRHHVVAFPQIGPGKGDGPQGDDDFGRARESGNDNERYHFRTPSLLNVALTAPYGHTGAFASLQQVVRHYVDPNNSVDNYFDQQQWCNLEQFESVENCETLNANGRANTGQALQKLNQERNAGTSQFRNIALNQQETADIVAFLESLTDRCAADQQCVQQWIPQPEESPDGQQLNAVNNNGIAL